MTTLGGEAKRRRFLEKYITTDDTAAILQLQYHLQPPLDSIAHSSYIDRKESNSYLDPSSLITPSDHHHH